MSVGRLPGRIEPMPSRWTELSVDCRDPRLVGEFWCAVLGYQITDDSQGVIQIGPGPLVRDEIRAGPIPPMIVFSPVPESKTVKNRLHIDVNPVGVPQEE